eukprot:GHVP01025855.1.p1 GENE.GHVP01025855.1~~GHVP01025855.1.p1  ORF type:complete len:586 (-),score=132.94 GHVP01025855.1:106-1863(-)
MPKMQPKKAPPTPRTDPGGLAGTTNAMPKLQPKLFSPKPGKTSSPQKSVDFGKLDSPKSSPKFSNIDAKPKGGGNFGLDTPLVFNRKSSIKNEPLTKRATMMKRAGTMSAAILDALAAEGSAVKQVLGISDSESDSDSSHSFSSRGKSFSKESRDSTGNSGSGTSASKQLTRRKSVFEAFTTDGPRRKTFLDAIPEDSPKTTGPKTTTRLPSRKAPPPPPRQGPPPAKNERTIKSSKKATPLPLPNRKALPPPPPRKQGAGGLYDLGGKLPPPGSPTAKKATPTAPPDKPPSFRSKPSVPKLNTKDSALKRTMTGGTNLTSGRDSSSNRQITLRDKINSSEIQTPRTTRNGISSKQSFKEILESTTPHFDPTIEVRLEQSKQALLNAGRKHNSRERTETQKNLSSINQVIPSINSSSMSNVSMPSTAASSRASTPIQKDKRKQKQPKQTEPSTFKKIWLWLTGSKPRQTESPETSDSIQPSEPVIVAQKPRTSKPANTFISQLNNRTPPCCLFNTPPDYTEIKQEEPEKLDTQKIRMKINKTIKFDIPSPDAARPTRPTKRPPRLMQGPTKELATNLKPAANRSS